MFFTPGTFKRFYDYYRARWPDLPKESKVEVRIVKDILHACNERDLEKIQIDAFFIRIHILNS